MSSAELEVKSLSVAQRGETKSFLIIFSVLVLIEAIIEVYSIKPIRYFMKPTVIILLILYYYQQIRSARNSFGRIILGALIFSFFGDVFLMFTEEIYFLLGLSSFAIAHLFYCYGYLANILSSQRKTEIVSIISSCIPYALASLALYNTMKPNLGSLRVPVGIYCCILSAMGCFSILRKSHTSTKSFKYTALGSLLFIISDSLIGLNMFVGINGDWTRPAIMITYYFGQYLISRGALYHIYTYDPIPKQE